MAHESRSAADQLIDRLLQDCYSFDVFQALRRLECAHPTAPRIGCSQRPEQDPARFGQEPSLAFAPSTIARCSLGSPGRVLRVFVRFTGLLGPNGPMPHHVTAYIRDRQLNHKDSAPAAFLDIFHHRIISLFYRAWACCQQTVQRDRPGEDQIATYVACLVGVGMQSLQNRDAVQDDAKLYYSGRLACLSKNAEGLEAILSDFFGVPARIDQFVGRWIDLPDDARCSLGQSPTTGVMGRTLVIGTRFWSCQQKFRIVIGPLTFQNLCRFLPTQRAFSRILAWVRSYLGDQLDWDVQLVLKAKEVPRLQLGTLGQLGWTTWLRTKESCRDRDDVVLRPLAA